MIKNKNILITGGNSGIGFFAIINLLKMKNIFPDSEVIIFSINFFNHKIYI